MWTAFLIALAPGCRCSEVLPLHSSDVASEHDGSLSLRFLSEFQYGYNNFTSDIESLVDFIGPDTEK